MSTTDGWCSVPSSDAEFDYILVPVGAYLGILAFRWTNAGYLVIGELPIVVLYFLVPLFCFACHISGGARHLLVYSFFFLIF